MVDRGMSWEMATTRADNFKGKYDGFYVSKRDMYGKKMYLLATQKEGSPHLFTIARQVEHCNLLTVHIYDLIGYNWNLPKKYWAD